MKIPLITLTLSILASSIAGDALAEIYKWVDENGVVNHSDSPPPNKSSVTVSDKSSRSQRQTVDEGMFTFDVEFNISGSVIV